MSLNTNLEQIASYCEPPAKQNGFTLRSPFTERFGSWQTVYVRTDATGLDRYVTIDLIDKDDETWVIELNAFVEGATLRARGKSLVINTEQSAGELSTGLATAFEQAVSLVPNEPRPNLFDSPITMRAGLAH